MLTNAKNVSGNFPRNWLITIPELVDREDKVSFQQNFIFHLLGVLHVPVFSIQCKCLKTIQ